MAALVCLTAGALVWPSASVAAPGTTDGQPSPPPPELIDPAPTEPAAGEPAPIQPPPPTLQPDPGIEFATPPAEVAEVVEPPPEDEPAALFPDPGMAPNDGASMLVLGGTTIALTGAAFGAGLAVGLRNQVPLEWLLPSTIVPTVGVLAFAGGGLYLGIKRARAYRRWEIGNRVIGSPQGGGLAVGGSFMLLGALALIPSGAFALRNGDTAVGATMIGLGSVAAVSMPIMFTLGSKRQHEYQRTGGWRRKPIPPLPPGAQEFDEAEEEDGEPIAMQVVPIAAPILGGVMVGAAGRF